MTPDPYEDDDDQPTLQRPSPASGLAPSQIGAPTRFASGMRAAYKLPEDLGPSGEAEAPFLDGGFPEEEDTAVDRQPLPSRPPAEDVPTATALPDEATATELPADGERDTATLPVDVAAVLRQASIPSSDDET